MRKDVNNFINNLGEEAQLLNKSEIARRMGCDRRTVDRYINPEISNNGAREYISSLEPFKAIIKEKVDTYGSTAMAVFKFIQSKGFTGQYGIVAKFVREHKSKQVQRATIRFETSPGLQAQVDWKENLKMINRKNEEFEVNIFLMVLGYSRYKVLILTADRTQETLFKCLIEAFKQIGGIPGEILFDNMSTVVDRAKSNFRRVEFNQSFESFADDAGFKPIACRPYRPQTKGKVEALAKLTSRLKPYNKEFDTFEDLEKITRSVMDELNNEISQATNMKPVERLMTEKEHLRPHPPMDVLMSYLSRQKEYKVSKESMVSYHGQKYSVPIEYIGKTVTVEETDDAIQIYFSKDLVVCHAKSVKKLNYKQEHIKEILRSDALSGYSDSDIESFMKEKLSMLDKLLD